MADIVTRARDALGRQEGSIAVYRGLVAELLAEHERLTAPVPEIEALVDAVVFTHRAAAAASATSPAATALRGEAAADPERARATLLAAIRAQVHIANTYRALLDGAVEKGFV